MKTSKPLRRQPRGVLASKPVFCQLMPNERSALERLSLQLGHSMSSVMRDIFLVGIEPYSEKANRLQAQPHTTSNAGR